MSVRLRLLGPSFILLMIVASYEFGQYHKGAPQPSAPKKVTPATPEPTETDQYLGEVKVVGPLANWMRDAEKSGDGDRQSESPAPPYTASELDRVLRRPTAAPENFVHTTFQVKTYTAFEILVPPGTIAASLSGKFESFTYAAARQRHPADVELLLLDETGYDDFTHHQAGSVIYSLDPCSGQSLKWHLNSDYHTVKKYYFVFHNPDSRAQSPSVKADFTVKYNE